MAAEHVSAPWPERPEYRALPPELAARLAPFVRIEPGPGRGAFPAVVREGVAAAAGHWGVAPREAMQRLLAAGVWPLRFARNRGVFSAAEQARLLASRVAVVGCGGLGGGLILLLARVGVGALTVCDYDGFDESNLNRQRLCREDNLGQNKAEAARDEIRRVASHVEVRVCAEKAVPESLPGILHGAEVAVDCLDSLPARHHLQDAAHAMGIPFVHGAIAGEEGFAMVCEAGRPGLRTVYGEIDESMGKGAEVRLGVPTITPAALGCFEASLTVGLLLGRSVGESVLWHMDLAAFTLSPMRM